MRMRKALALLLVVLSVVSCPFTPALAAEVDEPHIHTEDCVYEIHDDTDIVPVETADPEEASGTVDTDNIYEAEDDTDIVTGETPEVEVPADENDEPEAPADIPDDDLFFEDMEALALDGGISLYASHGCGIGTCTCTGSCSWAYTNYTPSSSTTHTMSVYCTGCGAYAISDVSGSHSFSGNTCTLCGYTKACSHPSTSRTWVTSCNYRDYCSSCGALVSSGTAHGPYTYGSWSYYNATQHRRSYTCSYGDSGTYYETANHSKTTSYAPYSATQHSVSSYCSTCSSTVGSVSYANHTFTYGSWESYSTTQHRRLKTCSTCGYSDYEYATHGFSYGSWANYNDTQHRRLRSCSTCGNSGYEYASHSYTYGSWASVSDEQHQRTGTCTCGNQTTQQEAHSVTYGAWSSVSDQQHQRTGACSCGYQATQREDHSLTYTAWGVASEETHKRTGACSCGYEATYEAAHADVDDDGYCDNCAYLMTRFSVTVPVSLSMTVSEHGEVYAATNAAIVNNSTGAVKVTSMTVTAENGWTLVPYSTDMSGAKVDAKQIGFALNDAETLSNGRVESLFMGRDWTIAKGGSLALLYDAVVSAFSTPVNEQVLTLVFVVDWAE